MKKLSLLTALALVACGSVAYAQQGASNPFARPAPGVSASAPGTPPATPGIAHGAVRNGMPNTATSVPGVPGASGVPGVPGMIPGTNSPYPSAPGMYNPGGMPTMVPQPGMPGPNGQETTEEEINASRIGTVNGMHIYKGQNTYMFEPAKSRKIVRRLVPNPAGMMPSLPPSAMAKPADTKNPNLPSMVGRPNPK